MPTGGTLRILLSSFLFVSTGLIQTVCIQAVLYSGGGDRSTFLLALPNYLGIVSVSFLGARCFRLLDSFGVWSAAGEEHNRVHLSVYRSKLKTTPRLTFFARLFHRDRRNLFILAFNELGGFLTGLTGLSIAGSGLYQVVFSGATVFTAILSTFFLRKRLTACQWLAVAVITFGLLLTAEQVAHMPVDAGTSSLISGLMFVLVSCLFYSTNYVIAEHLLDAQRMPESHYTDGSVLPPPSGLDLSLYTGGSCLALFVAYILAHTVPRWDALVTSSIARHHGNRLLIGEHYACLTVASFFHAVSHYDVVATVGAVAVGVLNALRAVSVFAVSSWLFCAWQASQCYSPRKGTATALVIAGAVAYSAATAVAAGRLARAAGYARLARADSRGGGGGVGGSNGSGGESKGGVGAGGSCAAKSSDDEDAAATSAGGESGRYLRRSTSCGMQVEGYTSLIREVSRVGSAPLAQAYGAWLSKCWQWKEGGGGNHKRSDSNVQVEDDEVENKERQ